MDGSLVIIEGSSLLGFCYSNGWQPCHYGSQSVVEIFVTPMDGSLVIMEQSLLSIFLLLQWMVTILLWKVVSCLDFCYSNGWQPCHYGRQSVVQIFFTTMDDSLVIMEGSLLLISLLLNGWQPFHYGRQSVVEIFVTPMDGSLVIMEGSLLQRFLYCNGWQPCHYGRQYVVEIFVIPMDGRVVIMKGSLLS